MKKILLFSFISMLMLAGCKNENTETEPTKATTETTETTPGTSVPAEESAEGLIENQYDGILIEASVPESTGMTSGSAVPITISVTNTGEENVYYVHGSGTHMIPEAIRLTSEQLQPVIPADHLGIATMDYVTKELKPGEELEYVIYLMLMEPTSEFNTITYDMFHNNQTYIADVGWRELSENYSDFKAIASGTYTNRAEFQYFLADDEGNPSLAAPTGVNKAEFTITVAE